MGTKIKDLNLLSPVTLDCVLPVSNVAGTFKTSVQDIVDIVSAVYTPTTTVRVRDAGTGDALVNILRFVNSAVDYTTVSPDSIATVTSQQRLSSIGAYVGSVSGVNCTNGLTASSTGEIGISTGYIAGIYNGERIPIGCVGYFALSAAPTNWLVCDGSEVLRISYPELFAILQDTWGAASDIAKFKLPDLRGEFIRGWDMNRGVDPGRTFASAQSSQNLSHTHDGITSSNGAHRHDAVELNIGLTGSGGADFSAKTGVTSLTGNHTHDLIINTEGGSEARPRNVALLPCIKALSGGTAAPVVTSSPSGFENSLIPGGNNGYQKLPTGFIMQWGLTTTIPSYTSYSVTFPIAFPNQCLFIGLLDSQASPNTTAAANPHLLSRSTTGYSALYPRIGTTTVNWFAIGF